MGVAVFVVGWGVGQSQSVRCRRRELSPVSEVKCEDLEGNRDRRQERKTLQVQSVCGTAAHARTRRRSFKLGRKCSRAVHLNSLTRIRTRAIENLSSRDIARRPTGQLDQA